MADTANRSKTHSLIHVEPLTKNSLSIADFFTSKFDYIIRSDMYVPHKNTYAVYDLFRQILVDKDKLIHSPIVTLSPDTSISASTIGGGCEKFLYRDDDIKSEAPIVKSDLRVIYVSSLPNIAIKKYETYEDFSGSVISDALGLNELSFSLSRVRLSPENLFLIGINEDVTPTDEEEIIKRYNIDSYSIQLMRKKGIAEIMSYVVDKVGDENVHIVIDLSVISPKYAPSVKRCLQTKDGFDIDELDIVVNHLKKLKNINGIDVTGYVFGLISEKEKHHVSNMLTVKLIQNIVSKFISLKTKSINIFNEESKFLIWRKVNDNDSKGWNILRGIDLQTREEIIKAIGDDNIITIPIDEGIASDYESYDALVTTSTMNEQQNKSYYTANSLYDCCLYPEEKISMMFELLNTPAVQAGIELELKRENELKTQTKSIPKITTKSKSKTKTKAESGSKSNSKSNPKSNPKSDSESKSNK